MVVVAHTNIDETFSIIAAKLITLFQYFTDLKYHHSISAFDESGCVTMHFLTKVNPVFSKAIYEIQILNISLQDWQDLESKLKRAIPELDCYSCVSVTG
jgi:hypothetical protein